MSHKYQIVVKGKVLDSADSLEVAEFLRRYYQAVHRSLVMIEFPNGFRYGKTTGRWSGKALSLQSLPKEREGS